MYSLARPFLFALDAERAHALGLRAIEMAYRTGTNPLLAKAIAPMPTRAFGLEFPNPVGLAAGLDKNGEHIDALLALGFGFVEIGTITPRPQQGNPKPRMFRLPREQAVINRMGFNNLGVDALVRNVERARRRRGLLGINIGKNKDTPNEDAASDYLHCLEKVYALADYVTVNISSPNTAGLRELQEEQALRQLVSQLREAQEALAARHGKRVPMLVKVAPDLSDSDIDAAARVLSDLQVDGVIATNTTVTRPGLEHDAVGAEAGGLSGAPLLEQSTLVLRRLRARLPEAIPLIGVGGILSGADAVAKMAAGAALVQCYSGLVFRGPALIGECVEAMRRRREAPSRGAGAAL
ncbi:quinone-dependent dihydroorotate dehydrogenase [Xanthomonas translucens]|uniref:Dihydroorotate dehydrogenase (quinone) n=1 Tax=Xanthomonas translucens pv. translucens DSM 18974 TaxID=1261556 RepID=A0A1C3TPQ4_XANCT|nr:quinone-dependent dihydroorotate dehydrogenase [Xanthomonas translucens]KTF35166.1 dihydroorotate dehydrogenase [Xanthomonas translucens pv. translucens]KWV10600.1 dihydroorotate dehydrogenase 2 [Xanthomonas translucens]MCC8445278.1 quinone-dependent dihydroorotate dehydrogenase [Xanthomonas translucens pv. translucens]MCS3360193.1 quinone-dependent dihydroorotate dehydrogenase [Xanthomonas translucens pv. translucens]MCS3374085.1 quinone-dependent dihydroorotate dehydrogenase [Xanthomonas 